MDRMNDDGFIPIRDSRNRVLFMYNPRTNVVNIKPKSTDVHSVVELDKIRQRYGYPEPQAQPSQTVFTSSVGVELSDQGVVKKDNMEV